MDHHKEVLIKYNVPAVYSLWEGYVRNSFTLYKNEINALKIPISKVHLNLLTHTLSGYDKLCLENPRMSFKSKKEFVEFYQNTINGHLVVCEKLPLKSNVDFDVIDELLMRFNLDTLPKSYKNKLSKLLQFRNSIAHGETSILVKIDHIVEFSTLVNNLMVEIYERIELGYNNSTFLA